ncbi:MAG: cyclomaltodextrinase C-terminal domain-containing protein [Flavobacteriia bacterium]|nr:cyclomaltodextrinase C-terminal domain-containing protein [Flavobacteriia bacterium]
MARNLIFITLFALIPTFSWAQNFFVDRIDPPSWMPKNGGDQVELLLKGSEFNEVQEVTSDNRALQIISIEHAESDEYIYVTVNLQPVEAETNIILTLNGGRRSSAANFTLHPWVERNHGLTASDYLYLITADRFANGDEMNDVFLDMNEDSIAREEPYARHGGDVQGIIDHLEYIESLGVTGLWISPLLENNEHQASYHGYAITDHYQLDRRNGTNEEYLELSNELKDRDMKLVMDVVYNHFGDQHYLFTNPPSRDWFNQWPEYTQTNYKATSLMDPYASEHDRNLMSNGWFDKHMPDVNQRNPHVANWLIQNSIWWVDMYGVDAFRIDTYAYPDQQFMADLDSILLDRYPDFFIFAETWVHHEPTQYWFMRENQDRVFNSHLQSVTDFQFYFALKEALTQESGWSNGMSKLYYVLAHDYWYDNPELLVTFADNHDEGRFFGMIGEDLRKYKIGLGIMMTTRGIPCLYYGTEILMKETDGHGKMRQDFPGGWASDTINKFEEDGRTAEEQEAFEFIAHLGRLRTSDPLLTQGKLTQWAVHDGVYVYTREWNDEVLMVIVNRNDDENSIEWSVYDEVLKRRRSFKVEGSTDYETGDVINITDAESALAPNSISILRAVQ